MAHGARLACHLAMRSTAAVATLLLAACTNTPKPACGDPSTCAFYVCDAGDPDGWRFPCACQALPVGATSPLCASCVCGAEGWACGECPVPPREPPCMCMPLDGGDLLSNCGQSAAPPTLDAGLGQPAWWNTWTRYDCGVDTLCVGSLWQTCAAYEDGGLAEQSFRDDVPTGACGVTAQRLVAGRRPLTGCTPVSSCVRRADGGCL